MQKKKKRQPRNILRSTLLFIIMLILLAFAIFSSFIMTNSSNSDFATEPWQDPYPLCSTHWHFVDQIENPPELMDAFATAEFDIESIVILQIEASCSLYSGNRGNISIQLQDSENWHTDAAQIGIIVNRILAIISETEISQTWGGDELIEVIFITEGNFVGRWSMNYIQANRAYEAGLTGLDLYELGLSR